MGRDLVTTLLRTLTIVIAATAAGSCFDVSTGRPTPILIDNFDSGDVLPADHHFDQWRCGQNDPPIPDNCHCGYSAAAYYSPPYSLHLAAAVTETGDKEANGAQLYTQGYVSEDLSNMHELVFSFLLNNGDPPLPGGARLDVELWCSDANSHVFQSVRDLPSGQWQTVALDMSRFGFVWVPIEGGPSACLAKVDSLHFSVNAGLALDKSADFDLYLDDVYFR